MIENETQYRVTRKQVAKFMLAIQAHDAAERPADIHPKLWQAMRDGMASQVEEMVEALNEWEGKDIGKDI